MFQGIYPNLGIELTSSQAVTTECFGSAYTSPAAVLEPK